MTTKFCFNMSLPILNNPKDLDPSYKMDLDFWDYFGREKTLSYNRGNTIHFNIKSANIFVGEK